MSADEQAREGFSPDNQTIKTAACYDLKDPELVELAEDAGRSGKDPGAGRDNKRERHNDKLYKM